MSPSFKARFHKAGLFPVCWLRGGDDFHLDLAVFSRRRVVANVTCAGWFPSEGRRLIVVQVKPISVPLSVSEPAKSYRENSEPGGFGRPGPEMASGRRRRRRRFDEVI